MVLKNDITGDTIRTKVNSDAYRENWERIFGDGVYLVFNDDHILIIVDYENNQNNMIRLNKVQFSNLKKKLCQIDEG